MKQEVSALGSSADQSQKSRRLTWLKKSANTSVLTLQCSPGKFGIDFYPKLCVRKKTSPQCLLLIESSEIRPLKNLNWILIWLNSTKSRLARLQKFQVFIFYQSRLRQARYQITANTPCTFKMLKFLFILRRLLPCLIFLLRCRLTQRWVKSKVISWPQKRGT